MEKILEDLKTFEEIINKEIDCIKNPNLEKCTNIENLESYLTEKDVTEICKNYLDYIITSIIKKLEDIPQISNLLDLLHKEKNIRFVIPKVYDTGAYYSIKSKKIIVNVTDEVVSNYCLNNFDHLGNNLDSISKAISRLILHELVHLFDHYTNRLRIGSYESSLVSEIKAYTVSYTLFEDENPLEMSLEFILNKLQKKIETFSLQRLIIIGKIESYRRYLEAITYNFNNIPEIKHKYENIMKKIDEMEKLYKLSFRTSELANVLGKAIAYYLNRIDNRKKFIEKLISKETLDEIIYMFKSIKKENKFLDIDITLDKEKKILKIGYKNKEYLLDIF
ncbi:MAG: hypothetical protein QW648_03140 [Nanoarchaeales archaeon]